jgi:hypothetical protein
MAVEFDGTYFPEPTGAVEFDDTPVDTSVTVDPAPTGAVENTGEPITTKFGPSGLRSTNTVEIPESQSFRAPGVKIVNGPEQEKPKGQSTAESRSARHASDDDNSGGR